MAEIEKPDKPTNVVDERLRLERIIKNEIQTPELKEGLLKRYLDYDEFVKGLPADRAEQLLDYTNQDVAFNLDLFKDQFNLQKPYYPGEMESIYSILFDWEEPSPIEDAVLADIEGWDIDAQGNPIDPRNKPEGMSKFQQELSAQYDYLVTSDTPTNVVDYQDTGIGGRPFEIEGGVPVDKSGNPIKSIGNADETITIYRVVPEGVDSVNANDWVFINKGQAEEALKNANANVDGNFNLIEMEVSRADVYPSTRGNLEMGYFPKDTPTNVVDDLAKQNELIDNFVNSIKTEGNLEFYVKHSGTTVSAGDIKYNPTIGKGSQIPGFYTEPLGIRDIKVMGGRGGADAVSNYYKVQVNSDNLLVDAISGQVTGTQSPITGVGKMYLGDQINKIDWNIFEQETGLNFERDFVGANKDPLIPTYEIKNGKKFTRLDVQTFIRNLESKGLTGDQIASALRKSGIEGFATGPINAQYEVVLIDPNDDLGIGSKLNIEDATEVEFLNNQSKVNKIDELVIAPTTVVDDVVQPSVIDDAIELVDNLNIDNVVKKEITEKLAKVGGQAAGQIPIPGIGQAIDFWETAVLVVGAALLAAGEVDELPKVVQNFGIDLYNGFLSSLNIPFTPVEKVEYTPNTDRIIKGLDIIDKLQPTSYAINPVIEEFQEIESTTPTMELPGFGTVPASKYYQPPVESTPERDNINSIMTNLMTNISNAQAAYPITASELSNFQRNPIQVVPSNSADKPEKVEYDSKEKQNLHDIYANMFTSLSESMMR